MQNPTLRSEIQRSLLARPVGSGASYDYYSLTHPELLGYGIKIPNHAGVFTQAGHDALPASMASARENRLTQHVLATTSHLALLHDPLRDLSVGQRVAHGLTETGSSGLRVHYNVEGSALSQRMRPIPTNHPDERGLRILALLNDMHQWSNDTLVSWLGTIRTLDERGYSIDKNGDNILYRTQGPVHVDVDDPSHAYGDARFTPDQNNHVEGVLFAIGKRLGIDSYLQSKSLRMSKGRPAPVLHETVMREWDAFGLRLKALGQEAGLAEDAAAYVPPDPAGFAYRDDTPLAVVSLDAPVGHVAALLREHHPPRAR